MSKIIILLKPKVNRKDAWKALPYGCGISRSGDAVIFDRRYAPLVLVKADGRVEPHDGSYVPYTALSFYFDDKCTPPVDPCVRRRISELMARVPGLLQAVETRRATLH